MMYPVSGEQDEFKLLAERFSLHYIPRDNGAKAQCHDLHAIERLREERRQKNKQISTLAQCDANAHHLLLRSVRSGQSIATSYVLPTQSGGGVPPILHGKPLPVLIGRARSQGARCDVSEMSVPVLSSVVAMQDWTPKDSWQVALYLSLASHALARLLFHDYLLAELPITSFKKFRMRGLSFEYAGDLPHSDASSALFYIDLNLDLASNSPLYDMSQHVSNVIAPQLNMPLLQEKEA